MNWLLNQRPGDISLRRHRKMADDSTEGNNAIAGRGPFPTDCREHFFIDWPILS